MAGLAERHPARTIFLIPEPGRDAKIEARAELKDFQIPGMSLEIVSEVVQIRLRGAALRHPGSILVPLLVSDLPVFCRWRGEPRWGSSGLEEIVALADRFVVDSSEWRGVPGSYGRLAALFDRVAVSDIAFARTLSWRRRLAELWPAIGSIEKLRVEGPRADAELIAGWLRSRLERNVVLSRRNAETVTAMWVDGEPVTAPGELLEPERAPLGRARPVRPRPGLRGVREGDYPLDRMSSAAATRLARPAPNVVTHRAAASGVLLG